jgi:hypothetical protein
VPKRKIHHRISNAVPIDVIIAASYSTANELSLLPNNVQDWLFIVMIIQQHPAFPNSLDNPMPSRLPANEDL